MEDKIYEKIKKLKIESSNHYLKLMGISDISPVTDTMPTKNLDLEIILTKTGLIEKHPKNMKKINEFHDYLYKFGINLGIGHSKRMIINAIQDGEVDFEELLDVNPNDYVDYNFQPTFIHDMKEAILNEK